MLENVYTALNEPLWRVVVKTQRKGELQRKKLKDM
jgi:hypothetical protein